MTVNISKPALNLREELAALRNQGGAYEESKFYLDSLVTNGTFDSDTAGWTSYGGTGSTSSGVLTVTNGSTAHKGILQTFTVQVGKSYMVSGKVTGGTSTAKVLVGASQGNGSLHNATAVAGTTIEFSVVVTPTSANFYISLQVSDANGTGLYDNISVHETDGTNAIHSTPYGYEIKDVYIDGDLAREGEAYDYTVHDGYIKPTIAPTATTETCLIGVRT